MNSFDIILLAIALAMDCFAVSVVSGVVLRRWEGGVILWLCFLFGLFQATMPLLGWIATAGFSRYIEAYDHWVAFALLLFLGLKMIREAFLPEEHQTFDPHRLTTQLMLAVATSIDALAVGISLAVMGYDTVASLLWPLIAIGLCSLLFELLGHALGIRFGRIIGRKLKPALVGGVLLILIGVKVLVSHISGSS